LWPEIVFCVQANEYKHKKTSRLAPLARGEFILLRPDSHILRQTPHKGQDQGEMPENATDKRAVAKQRWAGFLREEHRKAEARDNTLRG
jgi:hypothetical protein